MRLIRITLAVGSLFIIISLIAVLLLLLLVNPNKLKPAITEAVVKRTGYQLAIDGDLSWAFYPRLSVQVDHMTFIKPGQAQSFLDLRGVKIATHLSQLWGSKEKFDGKVYIANIKWMNVAIQNVATDLHWQNNILTLQPIQAALYGGSVGGIAHASYLATVPHWDWDLQFNQVQLQPLLQDISADKQLRLSGVGQMRMQGTTEGKNKDQLISHLNGKCEFNLQQGKLDGINLNYFIQAADALMNKKDITVPDNLNETQFDTFSGAVIIQNGMVVTQTLSLVSPAFITTGTGSLALASQTIQLQLKVKPQPNNETLNAKKWEIPVLVTGTLKRPQVRLNINDDQKLAIEREINKAKVKAREIIQEHVAGKAGALLQNLLGN